MNNQDLYINETSEEYDALVIGSGISGGWAAKEFCERGFKTLMVERGRIVEHQKDYIAEGKPVWQYPNRMKVDNLLVEEQYKVQQKSDSYHTLLILSRSTLARVQSYLTNKRARSDHH